LRKNTILSVGYIQLPERSKYEANVISADEVEKFVYFLNDQNENPGRPRLELEIEFLVRNGFNGALHSSEIAFEVNEFESPLALKCTDGSHDPKGRDDDFCLTVARQVEDYSRVKLGKLSMTQNERREWVPDPLPLRNPPKPLTDVEQVEYFQRTGQFKGGYFTPNDNQVIDAVKYIVQYYPEIVRYWNAAYSSSPKIQSIAEKQGYVGGREVGRSSLGGRYIIDAIRAVVDVELRGKVIVPFEVQEALFKVDYYDGRIDRA
jgi:hypothetical protein